MRIVAKWFALLLFISLLLVGCTSTAALSQANLTGITVDGWAVGSPVPDAQALSGYTADPSFDPAPNVYSFQELQMNMDEKLLITSLKGNLMGDHTVPVRLLADADSAIYTDVNQISGVLGNSYVDSWYDREQGLKVRRYTDRQHQLQASFIFVHKTQELVWVIVEGK